MKEEMTLEEAMKILDSCTAPPELYRKALRVYARAMRKKYARTPAGREARALAGLLREKRVSYCAVIPEGDHVRVIINGNHLYTMGVKIMMENNGYHPDLLEVHGNEIIWWGVPKEEDGE